MSLYEGAPEGGDSLTNPDGVAAAPAPAAAAPTTNADGEMIVPEYAPPVAAAAPGQSFAGNMFSKWQHCYEPYFVSCTEIKISV